MAWHRHTSLTNFIIQQSRSFEGVCDPLRLTNCLFPVPNSTYNDRAFPVAAVRTYRTIFRSILHLLRHFLTLYARMLRTLLPVITVVIVTVIYGYVNSYLLAYLLCLVPNAYSLTKCRHYITTNRPLGDQR